MAYASLFGTGLLTVSGASIGQAIGLHRRRGRIQSDHERGAVDLDRGDALIIMAKQPRPGATKTRLQPLLGLQGAAKLYECLLLDTLDLARSLPGVDVIVAVDPAEATDYFESVAPDMTVVAQVGDDLSDRLENILGYCFDQGYQRVAAIGSDSPTLPVANVASAFALLGQDQVDVVLGPADDGGYYLIGVKSRPGSLVTELEMSTPTVLADTLALAADQELTVELLSPWYDVDEPADLERLRNELTQPAGSGNHAPVAAHTRRLLERLDPWPAPVQAIPDA